MSLINCISSISGSVPARICAGLALVTLLSACNRDTVQVDQVPKEKTPPAAAASNATPADPHAGLNMSDPHAGLNMSNPHAMMNPSDPHAGLNMSALANMTNGGADVPNPPTWELPANWKPQTATPMVYKSFVVTGENDTKATLAVSLLAGQAGGTFANVNRWRGQLGLEPIAEADLDKTTQKLELPAGHATLVELSGTDVRTGKPAQMIVAMLPHGDDTWFFKFAGDGSVVAREKENLLKFLRSVRFP